LSTRCSWRHGIAPGAKTVTYDFARLMDGAKQVSCSAFGETIIQNMNLKTSVQATEFLIFIQE
jgi:hypothetical protein